MSAQHCPFHSIHTVVYCSQRKEETKNVHYNFNFGDVLCGEPDLRHTFTCVAAHCADQTKKRAAVCSGQYGFVLTGAARTDFRVQCPRICAGFQRPSGYIVRYSVLRSRTVLAGGCCKCRCMHVPDETQRKITPAASIYHRKYTIKTAFSGGFYYFNRVLQLPVWDELTLQV
mgnify:CR=1 FL=1